MNDSGMQSNYLFQLIEKLKWEWNILTNQLGARINTLRIYSRVLQWSDVSFVLIKTGLGMNQDT